MFKERYIHHLIVLFLAIHFTKSEDKTRDVDIREKRQINSLPIIYPYGGTYKFILGYSTPIPNDEHVSLLFQANMQFQYVQFTNITQLSQYYFIKEVSREERAADLIARRDERLVFYKSVADILDLKGMNGQDCVLRAICEAAQYPVQEEALVGEVLHILLTPDYGHMPFEDKDPEWVEAISMYKDAATAGRQMFNCGYIYSGCPQSQSILDLITTLRDE